MNKVFNRKIVNCCDDENYGFEYLSLVRDSDNQEVYTCSNFTRDDSNDVLDFDKISKTFNYYFTRVNSSIQQQFDSPKLSDEQKKELKFLDLSDYSIELKICMPNGYHSPVLWRKKACDMMKLL